jgi:hypothetical protein
MQPQTSSIGRGTFAAFAALGASAAGIAGFLFYLSLAEAGNSDLGDIIGLLGILLASGALGSSAALSLFAALLPGPPRFLPAILGPLATLFGFLAASSIHVVFDYIGVPRPDLDPIFATASFSGLLGAIMYVVSWMAARPTHPRPHST